MTAILEWLLGLENIRWERDSPLLLQWERHVEPWVFFSLAIFAAAVIGAVYLRERLSLTRTIAPALLRFLLIAVLAALLCGPAVVLQRNRTEPSCVVLMVDSSQSMSRKETYRDEELGKRMAAGAGVALPGELNQFSRLDLARRAVQQNNGAGFRAMTSKQALQLSAFAGGMETLAFAQEAEGVDGVLTSLNQITPDGGASDLAGALIRTMENPLGRRLSAIMVVSDGQATTPGNMKDAIELAQGRQVPIFAVRTGSPFVQADLELGPSKLEEAVYLHDVFSVQACVSIRGAQEPREVTVQLKEIATDGIVASARVVADPKQGCVPVELRVKPTRTGRQRYRVEAVALPGEENLENNVEVVEIQVIDARLRVLYVDAYPRYEYRYLKNALLREQTAELSALLLDADQEFVQEGTHPIRRFPETSEELARFDVILFGDVDPRSGWLTPAQMNLILDAVGNDGAGFGFLAGDRYTPQRFLGTPLEKLLPVRIDPEFTGQYESTLTTGFHPQLTPDGRISGLFRLPFDKDRASLDDASSGAADPTRLFESLPELYWIARTLGPKAGASVLVQHPTMRVRGDRAMGTDLVPMLVTGRFGAGRLVFQATDETWRWRRHRIGSTPAGELLHDTYWVQIARLLAKPQQIDRDRRILLQTDRRSYEFGDRVLVRVEVRSPELLARMGESVHVSFVESQSTTESNDRTQSAPKALRLEAHRSAPESNRFEAAGVPPKPGRYNVQLDDATFSSKDSLPTALIRVEQPNLEARRPEANHEMLQRITEATGGRILEPDQLETELGAIPDRNVQIPDDVVESLTDAPLPYVLFCLLITAEWILRRRFGLS